MIKFETMNEDEIDNWIENNNPYSIITDTDKYLGWCIGVRDYAEYLSSSENANNCDIKSKRWRAEEFESYWYIDSLLEVWGCTENNSPSDNARYAIGNYFKTEEAAKAMAEEIKKVLNQ